MPRIKTSYARLRLRRIPSPATTIICVVLTAVGVLSFAWVSREYGQGHLHSTIIKTDSAGPPRLTAAYRKVPLSFERNAGQTDARVKFLSRGPGYSLFLTGNEAV